MAILKRVKKEEIKDHVSEDSGEYFNVQKWLTKIMKVVDINTGEEWNIDSDCKMIYFYLNNFRKHHGRNNVYPNQDLISRELGINTRTLIRKLKVLSECGLIDTIKMKVEGENFYSNRYRINQPSYTQYRKWFGFDGVQLTGDRFTFKYSNFKRKQ